MSQGFVQFTYVIMLVFIQSEKTPHAKADKLIDILERREDRAFKWFCDVLTSQNRDLFKLLTENGGENVFGKQENLGNQLFDSRPTVASAPTWLERRKNVA